MEPSSKRVKKSSNRDVLSSSSSSSSSSSTRSTSPLERDSPFVTAKLPTAAADSILLVKKHKRRTKATTKTTDVEPPTLSDADASATITDATFQQRRVRFSSPAISSQILIPPREKHYHHPMSPREKTLKVFGCLFLLAMSCGLGLYVVQMSPPQKGATATDQHHQQQIDVKNFLSIRPSKISKLGTLTLREYLIDPEGIELALAPSFFGYYGYFGALAAWEDELSNSTFKVLSNEHVHAVAGASAGAMAAILIAAGVSPRRAAEFCSTITLDKFADFPGLLTVFRGNKFQQIMESFLRNASSLDTLDLEQAKIPVAVSGFDLQSWQGVLMQRGNMARAARASACFPFLFQPVGWIDGTKNYLFTDGGITDPSGVNGLSAFDRNTTLSTKRRRRVVNLVVGNFLGSPLGPSRMPMEGVEQVLSISIRNLPQCGPWAMKNGPLAVEGSRRAMTAALDEPLYLGSETGHYELHIDASSFVPDDQ